MTDPYRQPAPRPPPCKGGWRRNDGGWSVCRFDEGHVGPCWDAWGDPPPQVGEATAQTRREDPDDLHEPFT